MDSFTKLFSDMVKSGVTPQRMLNTAKNPTPTPAATDSATASASKNPQITPEMQDQIKGIGLLLAAAMRKSLALLQEEQQERDFIEEEVKPEYKEEKLKEVEQKFLQKRTTLIEELLQALAVILAFLNILPGHEKFSTAIESNIQALTETIRMIVYTTSPATKSTIDSTAETTALVAQKKGDVTHFRGTRPIFGGGEKGRMETTKDNGSQVHLNGNFDATGIDFVIEKVAENPSERKVTVICDAKFLPIIKNLGEKLAREKGYQPENIHFKIKDDKTGEIPENTSFTYAQLSSAIEEDKKKAQETAAVTAAEKTATLTAALEPNNAEDPVFMPTSTPQQRLDALAMEPPGLQRDAKLTSLAATPEHTVTVLAQATMTGNTEIYDSLLKQTLDQPAEGLLTTFQRLNEATAYMHPPTAWTDSERSEAQKLLESVPKSPQNDTSKSFVADFQANPILNSNPLIMSSVKDYEEARLDHNQAHDKLLSEINDNDTSKDLWNQTAKNPETPQETKDAMLRIKENKAQVGDHGLVIGALSKTANDMMKPQTTITPLANKLVAHQQSLEAVNISKKNLSKCAKRCTNDLKNPELLPPMQKCKKDLASELLTQSPGKAAQLMHLANKKGDETTLQLFVNPATVLGTEKSNYAFEILDEYNDGDDAKQHLVSLGHDSPATSAPTMQPNPNN